MCVYLCVPLLSVPVLLQPRDWSISMNKKERRLAYATAFQNAAESITVVEDLEVSCLQ